MLSLISFHSRLRVKTPLVIYLSRAPTTCVLRMNVSPDEDVSVCAQVMKHSGFMHVGSVTTYRVYTKNGDEWLFESSVLTDLIKAFEMVGFFGVV